MDWRSDQEINEEGLVLTYHHNSNHYPHYEVLTRSRMKMLKSLFTQMNQTVTPAKRYFATQRFAMDGLDRDKHPLVAEIAARVEQLLQAHQAFRDFDKMRELGTARQLDTTDLYFLSKNQLSQQYELYYCNPAEGIIELVNEYVECDWWERAFDSNLGFRDGDAALFVTANIKRSTKLFGRGYRHSLLEGGRMTERIMNCMQDSECTLSPVMTFFDKAVHSLLDINGYYEVVLSSLIIREEV